MTPFILAIGGVVALAVGLGSLMAYVVVLRQEVKALTIRVMWYSGRVEDLEDVADATHPEAAQALMRIRRLEYREYDEEVLH